jgi:hypothetical protein
MADSKGLTPVTVLLPNDLYEALAAKLAREKKDLSPVAVALLQMYVEDPIAADPDLERIEACRRHHAALRFNTAGSRQVTEPKWLDVNLVLAFTSGKLNDTAAIREFAIWVCLNQR